MTLGERVHTVPRSVPTDQLLFKVFMGQRDKGRSAKALLDLFERPLVGSRPAWGSSPDCLTEYRRDPTDPHLLLQPSFFILYLLSAWSPGAVCERCHHKGTEPPAETDLNPTLLPRVFVSLSLYRSVRWSHGLCWVPVCFPSFLSFLRHVFLSVPSYSGADL